MPPRAGSAHHRTCSPAHMLTGSGRMLVDVRITAKTDSAIRALVEMAAVSTDGRLVKAEAVADAQQIPSRSLLGILNELRHAGIVDSRRAVEGGYRLAKRAEDI